MTLLARSWLPAGLMTRSRYLPELGLLLEFGGYLVAERTGAPGSRSPASEPPRGEIPAYSLGAPFGFTFYRPAP